MYTSRTTCDFPRLQKSLDVLWPNLYRSSHRGREHQAQRRYAQCLRELHSPGVAGQRRMRDPGQEAHCKSGDRQRFYLDRCTSQGTVLERTLGRSLSRLARPPARHRRPPGKHKPSSLIPPRNQWRQRQLFGWLRYRLLRSSAPFLLPPGLARSGRPRIGTSPSDLHGGETSTRERGHETFTFRRSKPLVQSSLSWDRSLRSGSITGHFQSVTIGEESPFHPGMTRLDVKALRIRTSNADEHLRPRWPEVKGF